MTENTHIPTNKIKSLVEGLISKIKQKSHQAKEMVNNKLEEDNRPTYFNDAQDWNYDHVHSIVVSRNRWKAMCMWIALPFIGLLLIMMLFLIPAQHVEPFLVNHYENGLVSVQPTHQLEAPTDKAQVESDIIRYIVNRESYSAATYDQTYNLTLLLSDNDIAKDYLQSQSSSNKQSPVNVLGAKGTQSVHVESVIFLDNEADAKNDKFHKHRNLAQVDFTVTQKLANIGQPRQIPLTALVSWDYKGTPDDPNVRWQNWAGFTVTDFVIQQRSVTDQQ